MTLKIGAEENQAEWIRNTPDEDEEPEDEKAWVPYKGTRGGEGWQNTRTGEVRYQKEPPGGVPSPDDLTDEQIEGIAENVGTQPGLIREYLGEESERSASREAAEDLRVDDTVVIADPSSISRAIEDRVREVGDDHVNIGGFEYPKDYVNNRVVAWPDDPNPVEDPVEPTPPNSVFGDSPPTPDLPGDVEDDGTVQGVSANEVESARQSAFRDLREHYSDGAVDAVEESVQTWDDGGYTGPGTAVVWAAARALNGGTIPDYPAAELPVLDEEAVAAAADFIRINREAAKERYGDSVEVCRGMTRATLENHTEQTEDGVRVQPNALESWTRAETTAVSYGDVMLKRTVDTDEVMFLSELTLDGVHSTVQEVTTGGEAYTVPAEDVEINDPDGGRIMDDIRSEFEKAGTAPTPLPDSEIDWLREATGLPVFDEEEQSNPDTAAEKLVSFFESLLG